MVGNKTGYDDNGFNMEGYNIKGEFNEYIDSVEELHDGNAKQVVINNVLYNKHMRIKYLLEQNYQ